MNSEEEEMVGKTYGEDSQATITQVLDEDNSVGIAEIDLHGPDWFESHVEIDKLEMAIEEATSDNATHVKFYTNKNGVVVVEKGYKEGVIVMPVVSRSIEGRMDNG